MQFAPVGPDIAALADGVILLLGALLIAFSLVLIYILLVLRPLHEELSKSYRARAAVLLIFLVAGGALYLAPAFSPDRLVWLAIMVAVAATVIAAMFYFSWVRLLVFCLFFLLWAGTIYVAHTFARDLHLLSAIVALTTGTIITAIFYFACVRPLVRVDDSRIAYTMMLVGAVGLLTILALVVLWFAQDRIRLDTTATLEVAALLQAAGVVISAVGIVFTYLMRTEQANRTANLQIYQTLELQSVELFRFEADHPDLVENLWFGPIPPSLLSEEVQLSPREETEIYVLRQYVCQILNLFEMAYRFRIRGIMEPEVYGSWVIWMWELCESEVFCAFWRHPDGLPSNYVKGFSTAMERGVWLRINEPSEERRKALFFDQLAKDVGCPEIKEWLK
jgi:hypothetical protein